jgi:hypothetical protein
MTDFVEDSGSAKPNRTRVTKSALYNSILHCTWCNAKKKFLNTVQARKQQVVSIINYISCDLQIIQLFKRQWQIHIQRLILSSKPPVLTYYTYTLRWEYTVTTFPRYRLVSCLICAKTVDGGRRAYGVSVRHLCSSSTGQSLRIDPIGSNAIINKTMNIIR